jgi:hypothetical protein
MGYKVYVADNWGAGEQPACQRREYASIADALAACESIIDSSLSEFMKPGMSADELWSAYAQFGDDAFIISSGVEPIEFSGWDYAKQRCHALTQQ